jgi:hypothetical protein
MRWRIIVGIALISVAFLGYGKGKDVDNFLWVAFDAPLKFEQGFILRKKFRVDRIAHFVARFILPAPEVYEPNPNDITFDYRLNRDGVGVAQGHCPPYVGGTIFGGEEHRFFCPFYGSVWADYEVEIKVRSAVSSAAMTPAHVTVGLDPEYFLFGKGLLILPPVAGFFGRR